MFAAYSAVHVSRGNRACHVFGIPLIFLTAAGILDHLLSPLAGAVLLAALAGIWLSLEWRLGLLAALAAPAVWAAGLALPLSANVALFVIGNAVPLAGHVLFEKGGPASLREGAFGTLIAPLWLLNLLLRRE